MKQEWFLTLIVAGLMTSCGTEFTVGTIEPSSVTSTLISAKPTLTIQPSSVTSTPISAKPTLTTVTPEPTENSSVGKVNLSWNPNPAEPILSATFCCGKVTRVVLFNYIPDARIWGDGHIIWTQLTDNGQRHVLKGQLTSEQMQTLLQRLSDTGFFSWQDRYADRSIADAAEQCLMVELETQSKKVCEYVAGAPVVFHELYTYIAAGSGATGQDYTPTIGYLTAHPLPLPANLTPPIDFKWPAATLGLSLDQAINGVWVEGKALETSWQMVNTKWRGSIIQDGDAYYSISLQIPGLSQVEPPAR